MKFPLDMKFLFGIQILIASLIVTLDQRELWLVILNNQLKVEYFKNNQYQGLILFFKLLLKIFPIDHFLLYSTFISKAIQMQNIKVYLDIWRLKFIKQNNNQGFLEYSTRLSNTNPPLVFTTYDQTPGLSINLQ
ncbi:unnamed protein product [Paramecium octaurelia]|uniref:Uncharacterized protein n=1 Tax=Paramecium octaurelia TaxID=43137 RepID=A0A8S1X638_PAROT|nr:unnamed protein product [Paramecium octaurelia]